METRVCDGIRFCLKALNETYDAYGLIVTGMIYKDMDYLLDRGYVGLLVFDDMRMEYFCAVYADNVIAHEIYADVVADEAALARRRSAVM